MTHDANAGTSNRRSRWRSHFVYGNSSVTLQRGVGVAQGSAGLPMGATWTGWNYRKIQYR